MLFRRSPKKSNSHENLLSLTSSGSTSTSTSASNTASQRIIPVSSLSVSVSESVSEQDKDVIDNNLINDGEDDDNKKDSHNHNHNHNHRRHSSNSSNSINSIKMWLSISTITGITGITSYMNSTRLMVLIVLCLQNSLFTVLRRYSQGVLKEDYSKHELLLVAELIKIVYSSWMISKNLKSANNDLDAPDAPDAPDEPLSLQQQQPTSPSKQQHHHHHKSQSLSLSKQLLYLISTSRKMFVLALIYGAMNILSFISLRNISAGTFTIFAQMKILTTATFSTLILKRSYSWTKWRSLFTLMLGVLLFSEPIWGGIFNNNSSSTYADVDGTGGNAFLGTIAVTIEVTLSGFASIYFEKVIKTDPLQLGIWERNFQLALSSVPVYLIFIIGNGGGTSGGFFTGWSILAFSLSLLGAAGGLLVALSIKYGDSILKTLATTGAIVLTGVLDHVFLGGPLTPSMIIAGLQVIISICNYTFDATVEVPASAAAATIQEAATSTNNNKKKKNVSSGGDDDDDDETELLLLQRSPMKRTGSSDSKGEPYVV